MPTTAPSPLPSPKTPRTASADAQTVDPFIEQQIRRTRRTLKWVDFLTATVTMLVGLLLFLLAAAVLDQWIVPGGLGVWGRTALFSLLAGGIAWRLWHSFVPLFQPINPVFAAQTIESNSPGLKNSLLNLLLFRTHRRRMSAKVYQAIERQAAQRLSEASLEGVVDRTALLRWGYVLTGVIALCALYRILSPKDPAISAGRVLAPWAAIAPPSRVQILAVDPGDAIVARGEQLTVSAEVFGLSADELPRIRYSTADEQLLNERSNMTRIDEGPRYQGQLPARRPAAVASGGINQELEYWIEAGDARTPKFRVTVYARPTLVVTGLNYEYPAYTGYPSESSRGTGDVRAIEGTRVTVEAVANQPIETAHIDFDADGRKDLAMQVDGDRAAATFELKLRGDRRTPEHGSYVLRLRTKAGRVNRDPPKYRIEVTPDYPPEVALTAPEADDVQLAVDASVQLAVEARDVDFALRRVRFVGTARGSKLLLADLLSEDQPGQFAGDAELTPAELKLAPGDVLEYWAEAEDNRRPEANLTKTQRRKIRIIDRPNRDVPPQDRQGDPQQQPQENQPGEDGGQGEGGEQGEGGGAGGEGQGEAADSDPNAGGAPGEGQQGETQQGEPQQGGGDGSGDQQDAQSPGGAGENAGDGKQQADAQNDANAAAEREAGGEQTPGEPGSDDQQPGDNGGGPRDAQAGRQPNSDPSQQAQPGDQKQDPLSTEGDQDGEAFQRMADHFNQQESNDDQGAQNEPGAADQQADQANDGQRPPEGRNEGTAGERPGASEEPADREQAAGESAENSDGQAQQAAPQPGAEPSSPQPTGDRAEPSADDRQNPAGQRPQDQQGDRADPDASAEPGANDGNQPQQENTRGKPDGEPQPQEPGATGEANRNQGEAGDGQEQGEPQGAPGADPKNPRDKPGREGEPLETGDDQGAPAESRGKTESDTDGSQSGDRSGDGQEGAGQRSDGAGQDGPGQNTPADEGSGAADEPGAGETGGPGDDQLSDSSSGDQSGGESAPAEGERGQSGKTQGSEGRSSDAGEPGDPSQPREPGEPNDASPGSSSEPPQAGGQAGGTQGSESSAPGEAMAGDDPNQKFAQEQTDLVLEKLSDQLSQRDVDENLLDKLGWDPQDLQKFVDRWNGLKNRAAQGDQQGQQELAEALRKLGLRREGPRRFRANAEADALRNLNEAYRSRIPAKYRDAARAYIKGVATGPKAQQSPQEAGSRD